MSTRLRCVRGHFLPATARPTSGPDGWDDTCRCVLRPRRRRRRVRYEFTDLGGQGLTTRQLNTMTTVQLTGSYL